MKILINLQVGSVRVSELRNTLCIRFKGCVDARFTWKPSRWSIPLVRFGLSVRRHTGGICSTRIDFQLGTNAADSNGLNDAREACASNKHVAKRVHPPGQRRAAFHSPRNGTESDDRSVTFVGSRSVSARDYLGLSPARVTKCAEKAHRYNRPGGTCAH